MLEIFGVPFSAHTRKVLVGVREKGLAHRLIPLVPLNPTPEFLAMNPLRKIPVLRHGDLILPDSTAIALYLDRIHAERPLYPTDPSTYARALWIEEFVDSGLAPHVLHGVLFQRVFGPKFLGLQPDAELIAKALEHEIPACLAYLERELSSEWFAGGSSSYADVSVASMLLNFHYAGESLDRAAYPRLHEWLRRVLRQPSFAAAIAAELPALRDLGALDLGLLHELGY